MSRDRERSTSLTIHTRIAAPSHTKPSREEVEAAFRTIIRWAGDDPDRAGLLGNAGARRARVPRVFRRL